MPWSRGVDEPVKLKIPPRECECCGGKYIPTGPRQKYCPTCKRLTPEEREERNHMKKEKQEDVKVYVDESLIKKKPAPVTEKDLDELDEMVEKAKKDNEFIQGMIDLLEKQYGVRLMRMDDVMPVQLTVAGKTYDGIWVEKRSW